MHSSDGNGSDARVSLGRHFRFPYILRIYKGVFRPHGHHGKRSVDGRRLCSPPWTVGVAVSTGMAVVTEDGASIGPRRAHSTLGTRADRQVRLKPVLN